MRVSERVHVGGCILSEKEELGLIACLLIDARKQLSRKKLRQFSARDKKIEKPKKMV